MKKLNNVVKLFFAVILLQSCGGTTELDVTPSSTEIQGDLSDYFEIVDGSYKVIKSTAMFQDWKISVKIKRNETPYTFEYKAIDDQNMTSDNAFYLDLVDANGSPIAEFEKFKAEGVFKDMFDTPIGSETNLVFVKDVSAENEESLPDGVEHIKIKTSITLWDTDLSSDDNSSSDDASTSMSSEDISSTIDDYEEFVDDYIVVFKKSMKLAKKAQEGDMDAMTESAEISQESMSLMEKAESLNDKLEAIQGDMSSSDLNRFMKIQTKLASAAMETM